MKSFLHLGPSLLIATVSLLLFSSAAVAQTAPKREMRATWIASVANIDWPSKEARGNSKQQQQEMISMLDSLKKIGINMVVFQVRPTADALYSSDIEPWSSWLTGQQGQDNDLSYDPLTFVCQEAHQRCIDVHVWVNPYRVTNQFDTTDLAPTHIFRQHKEWFWKYGKQWYFDPSLQQTRDFLAHVVGDITRRYDIDAIHMDDYFYPYPIRQEQLPDTMQFKADPRGFTDIRDWRRDNVNLAIRQVKDTIQAIKPWVEFGISPFGIWRNISSDPKGSKTNGLQNYDDLYADILLWIEQGWIDYITPQLYWEIGKRVADYAVLVKWWAEHSPNINYYVGHSVSGLGQRRAAEPWRRPNEICRQISMNRSIEQVQGSIFFPATGLLRNPLGLCDSLRHNYYRLPALHPINKNLQPEIALSPTNLQLHKQPHHYLLSWDQEEATGGQQTSYFVVYAFPEFEKADFDDPRYIIAITHDKELVLDIDPEEFYICVTSVNRYKQESLPCLLKN